ncbi:MAG: methyltransferase domain-containing protein [Gemmataceae bacterium]
MERRTNVFAKGIEMGVGTIHSRDLDQFVSECDRRGGIAHPDAVKYVEDFDLRFETAVDKTLDPFSDAYFSQQQALYSELAGRKLDQSTGELSPLDPTAHTSGCNPYNSRDVGFISKHARTIHTCLLMADLPAGAKILDAGSGWGLSSEMMAFAGAEVTAVDINPPFVELVRRRSERLGLPITSVHATFDEFETDQQFDLLFFYECLHHSLKPWETVARLGRFVKSGGKITIAGEPINAIWWPHWGIRLDALSVYCIRKFGWWESGWTEEFIVRCFERAGFTLTLYPHVGLANGHVGVGVREPVKLELSILEPFRQIAAAAPPAEVVATAPPPPAPTWDESALRAENAALRHALADMQSSRSWRVTAPMRYLFQKFGVSRAA